MQHQLANAGLCSTLFQRRRERNQSLRINSMTYSAISTVIRVAWNI